jgi:hypothetical protein
MVKIVAPQTSQIFFALHFIVAQVSQPKARVVKKAIALSPPICVRTEWLDEYGEYWEKGGEV